MGSLESVDCLSGKAVIVGARQNPRGAVVVLPPAADQEAESFSLNDVLGRLTPDHVIDIVCMQERIHGDEGLRPPQDL